MLIEINDDYFYYYLLLIQAFKKHYFLLLFYNNVTITKCMKSKRTNKKYTFYSLHTYNYVHCVQNNGFINKCSLLLYYSVANVSLQIIKLKCPIIMTKTSFQKIYKYDNKTTYFY